MSRNRTSLYYATLHNNSQSLPVFSVNDAKHLQYFYISVSCISKNVSLFSINAKLPRFIVRIFRRRVFRHRVVVLRTTSVRVHTSFSAAHVGCIQRPAAWRSGGFHCTFCGLLPFMFARQFQRSDCRRCAKPHVVGWHLPLSTSLVRRTISVR